MLTAVPMRPSTYASTDLSEQWYWESQRLVLARFDTTVSVSCERSEYHPHAIILAFSFSRVHYSSHPPGRPRSLRKRRLRMLGLEDPVRPTPPSPMCPATRV